MQKTSGWDFSVLKTKEQFENLYNTIGVTDDSLKNFLASEKYGEKNLANFTLYLKDQQKSVKGLTAGLKGLGKSVAGGLKAMAVQIAVSAVAWGVGKLLSLKSDAANKAHEAYEAANEKIQQFYKREEVVMGSTKELTDLLTSSDWGALHMRVHNNTD